MSAATYQPLKDDGAKFQCKECGGRDRAEAMWFVKTPDGFKGVYHKDCLDSDWLELATFVPEHV